MKLNQILEAEKTISLTVSIGDYLTKTGRPSPSTMKDLNKLEHYITHEITKTFGGNIVGATRNSFTKEAQITMDFQKEADRVRAVKRLRGMNTDYIRNVRSH